jgi:phospholipid/cholesterol/gamma-HCH transport system substrate-binding protein
MSEENARSAELKVGLFVLFGIAAVITVMVILGAKRHLFQHRVRVHAVFSDVGGLVVGAPVQISGVNAGIVSRISFDRSLPQPTIRVDMDIAQSALDLLREDSVARISSQGLLGDKLIDISAGSRSTPAIRPEGLVASAPPASIDRLIGQTNQVMERLQVVADNAARISGALSSPRTLSDIQRSLAATRALLEATAHGEGLAHALFYDRSTAHALGSIATGIDHLVDHVNRTVAALQPIFESTNGEGRQLVNNLSHAARGIGDLAGGIHRSNIVPNLGRASADLAQVSNQLRSGGGTLGALIQDPTVYEQLVTILGGVARSRVLRALIRYAISKDETAKKLKPPPGEKRIHPTTPPSAPPVRPQGNR